MENQLPTTDVIVHSIGVPGIYIYLLAASTKIYAVHIFLAWLSSVVYKSFWVYKIKK